MAKLYEDMYQAYLKVSGNWDDEAAYAAFAILAKKYLGATKFADGLERGRLTVELTRRRIHEKGYVSTPGDLDVDFVADKREAKELRLDDVGAGQASDADGHSDVSKEHGGTPQLDEREEQGRATALARDRDNVDGNQSKDQSLGNETVCDPLQGRTGQSGSPELSRDNVHNTRSRQSRLHKPDHGDNTKGGGKDSNPEDKRTRRRKSNAQDKTEPTT